MPPSLRSLANLLSLSRLVVAPVLPMVALSGMPRATMALIAWGFVSDAIDGPVARMTGSQSDRGATLDSLCDVVFYSAAIIAFVIAWPEAAAPLVRTWIVSAAALVVPTILGWVKFAQLPSYHTVLSRVTLAAFGLALLWFQASGQTWPFRAASALAVVSALDDMLITLILREPRRHVPHVLSLLRPASIARFDATILKP